MFFQILSARRTVDLKTLRVDVNQGFDLEVRFESLFITGACLSSSERKPNVIAAPANYIFFIMLPIDSQWVVFYSTSIDLIIVYNMYH